MKPYIRIVIAILTFTAAALLASCGLGVSKVGGRSGIFSKRASSASTSPAANPLIWLKADALTSLNDGDVVSSWTDSSTNANNADQAVLAFQPVYKTAIINGKPVVRFASDLDLDYLETPILTVGARSYFVVMKVTGAQMGIYHSIILQNSAPFMQLYGDSADNWYFYDGTGSYSLGPVVTGNVVLVSITDSGTLTNAFVDGVQVLTNNAHAPTTVTDIFQIGGYSGAPYGLTGDIAEVIIYDSALSTTDREATEDYLAAKYGL